MPSSCIAWQLKRYVLFCSLCRLQFAFDQTYDMVTANPTQEGWLYDLMLVYKSGAMLPVTYSAAITVPDDPDFIVTRNVLNVSGPTAVVTVLWQLT